MKVTVELFLAFLISCAAGAQCGIKSPDQCCQTLEMLSNRIRALEAELQSCTMERQSTLPPPTQNFGPPTNNSGRIPPPPPPIPTPSAFKATAEKLKTRNQNNPGDPTGGSSHQGTPQQASQNRRPERSPKDEEFMKAILNARLKKTSTPSNNMSQRPQVNQTPQTDLRNKLKPVTMRPLESQNMPSQQQQQQQQQQQNHPFGQRVVLRRR